MSINQRKENRTSIPESEIPTILALRRKGISLIAIAERYGCTPYPIQTICKRHNVFHKYVPDGPYYWTDERKELIARLWREGKSYEEIATHFKRKTAASIANLVCLMRKEGWDVPRRAKNQYIRKPGVTYLNK